MTDIEQVETFSVAGNSLPRLIHSVMLLKLMPLGLGPGDTRNPCVVAVGLQILRWFLHHQTLRTEVIFLANSSHAAAEMCAFCKEKGNWWSAMGTCLG